MGGLIYLRLQTGTSRDYSELRTNIRATHILQGITLVTIEGKAMKDHLADCNAGNCTVLEKELPTIFERTLQKSQDYLFTITQNQRTILRLGNCTEGIATNFPIIRQGIAFDLQLKICPK